MIKHSAIHLRQSTFNLLYTQPVKPIEHPEHLEPLNPYKYLQIQKTRIKLDL